MKSALLAALLFSCALVRADVPAVRRQVTRIETMKLVGAGRDKSGLSTEGARIVVFRDAHKIPHKIIADVYGETGQKQEIIYLNHGLPLFVRSVEKRYVAPLGTGGSPRIASTVETRLYFDKGHLLEKRVGSKALALTASQKRAIESQTRATVKTYLGKG